MVSQAKNIYEVKIGLHVKDASIGEIFDVIERKTEYVFAYKTRTGRADAQPKWTLDYDKESVGKILDFLGAHAGLKFKQTSYTIAVMEKEDGPKKIGMTDIPVRVIVKDNATGEPLPGASVNVKGTLTGIVTDGNGQYTLTVPEDAVLVFSFVGYQPVEIAVNSQTLIDVRLSGDVTTLEDVVVIGYGTQDRADLTSSIGMLKSKDLVDQPVASFDQAMTGRIAGVQVLQTSGEPGKAATFRIRGVNSITAGNDPLFVVDGIPLDAGTQAIDLINTGDIASVEVLKDASSAAIYGSRGANGVVLITTRLGQEGRINVQYHASYGQQQVTKNIDLLNAYQFAALAKDGHDNAYLDITPGASASDPDNIRPRGFMKTPTELYPYLEGTPGLTDTDWQSQIFDTAPISSHMISFSGGSNKMRYFLSGTYLDQQGIVIHSGYKRYTVRANVEAAMGRLRVGFNLNPSYTRQKRVQASGPHGDGGVVSSSLTMSPTWSVYNEDGTYNFKGNGYWRIGTDYEHNEILNPVATASLIDDNTGGANLLGRIYAEYEIVKGLKYLISFGGTIDDNTNNYYRPSTLPNLGRSFLDSPSNPIGRVQNEQSYNYVFDQTLTWNKNYGSHHLTALGGFSAQKNYRNYSSTTATNFPNDLVRTLNAGEVVSTTQDISEWALLSYLGRAQYDFMGKYLLTAALRADGSSRFGVNNRWGYFPSVSAGWRLSEERFMQDMPVISDLKLRASYGLTGNFQIGNYEHIARLSQQNYVLGTGSGNRVSGLASASASNPDLRWEKTNMLDVGLDIGLWEDRFRIEADYYNSNTADLLMSLPVPSITGFGEVIQNVGEVNNKGWEVTLKSHFDLGPVTWTGSFNMAANKNSVTRLGSEGTPIIKYPNGTAVPDHTTFITRVGDPIGSYYLLEQDGVYETQDELDSSVKFPSSRVGDFKFKDIDGDNVLDVNLDRAVVDSYFPDYTLGFSSTFSYRGIDLGIVLQSSQGFEILNLQRRYINSMEGNFNNMKDALGRWRSEEMPGNGNVNRANRKATGNNGRISSWHVEDGSYTRLQNITLGYSFPAAWLKKVKITSARICFSGQNLITWTDYSGFNPEVNLFDTRDALTPGVDYGSYPLAKTYSLSVNLGF